MKEYVIIMISVMSLCLKNIKKQNTYRRKAIKSSVYNLCGFRMSTKKSEI